MQVLSQAHEIFWFPVLLATMSSEDEKESTPSASPPRAPLQEITNTTTLSPNIDTEDTTMENTEEKNPETQDHDPESSEEKPAVESKGEDAIPCQTTESIGQEVTAEAVDDKKEHNMTEQTPINPTEHCIAQQQDQMNNALHNLAMHGTGLFNGLQTASAPIEQPMPKPCKFQSQLQEMDKKMKQLGAGGDLEGAVRVQSAIKEINGLEAKMHEQGALQDFTGALACQMKITSTIGEYIQVSSTSLQQQPNVKRSTRVDELIKDIAQKTQEHEYAMAQSLKEELLSLLKLIQASPTPCSQSAQDNPYSQAFSRTTPSEGDESPAKRIKLMHSKAEGKMVELRQQIQDCATIEDYKGAALLTNVATEIKHLDTEMTDKAAVQDYVAAAEMELKLSNLMNDGKQTTESVSQQGLDDRMKEDEVQKRMSELETKMHDLSKEGDYVGADLIKTQLATLRPNNAPSKSKGKGGPGKAAIAKEMSIVDMLRPNTPFPCAVKITACRVLCYGKPSTVASKGKNKGKGKDKGKGSGKGGGKGQDSEMQNVQVCYIGQADGHIMCLAAFGSATAQVPSTMPTTIVDVSPLVPKPGVAGLLHFTDQTIMSPTRLTTPTDFDYDTSAVGNHLATLDLVQQSPIGHHLDLVIFVQSTEEKYTETKHELYIVVYGIDMAGQTTGALRLWRFESDDVQQGKTYIARGVRVAAVTAWNGEQNRYAPRDDGAKTVECCWRTALEDVSHVSDITSWFTRQ